MSERPESSLIVDRVRAEARSEAKKLVVAIDASFDQDGVVGSRRNSAEGPAGVRNPNDR
ncbi:hypothetical protein ABT340_32845 [Streptosporangium sp. NPDC000239]|uniref:hypothetical protein n=1 Tax=Streptosporangium sp. NPDC000239 TaxID=3154248 RepID=UPI00332A34FD